MPAPTDTEIDIQFKAAYDSLGLKYDEPEEGSKTARSNYWFIRDLKKIAKFLYAGDLFKESLNQLEEEMQALYKRRSGKASLSNINLRTIGESWMGEPIPAHSAFLLQSVLANNELQEGFNGLESVDEKLHPVKFFGNLSSESFASNIKGRHLAVDYVGGDHGEYTHRVQWYCISKAAEALGLECRRRNDRNTGGLFQRSGPVWLKVFDRTEESDINDFRRPEKLNLFLGNPTDSDQKNWPMLTGFLRSRKAKTNGYTLELKKLLAAKYAYNMPVQEGFLRYSTSDARKELTRLTKLDVNPLTVEQVREIEEFLESNRVMTARDKFYVGSSEKPL
jgi:hypothetical protein